MALRKLDTEEIDKLNFASPLQEAQPKTAQDLLSKMSGLLDAIFGGGVVGEAIGAQIAKRTVPEEQREFISGPTRKQIEALVRQQAWRDTVFGDNKRLRSHL